MNEKLRNRPEDEPAEPSSEKSIKFAERLRMLAQTEGIERKVEGQKQFSEAVSERSVGKFLDSLKEVSGQELQEMCATIDYFIAEWDPTYRDFLLSIKAQLQTLISIRGRTE